MRHRTANVERIVEDSSRLGVWFDGWNEGDGGINDVFKFSWLTWVSTEAVKWPKGHQRRSRYGELLIEINVSVWLEFPFGLTFDYLGLKIAIDRRNSEI